LATRVSINKKSSPTTNRIIRIANPYEPGKTTPKEQAAQQSGRAYKPKQHDYSHAGHDEKERQ
jgi:hypothetical protein